MDEAATDEVPDDVPGCVPAPLCSQPALTLPVMLRAARHFGDLSQRELAARAGISKSYLGDLESGRAVAPSYPLVVRLIEATGLQLQALTPSTAPLAQRPYDGLRDKGGRHWPAHLHVLPVQSDRDWWYSRDRPGERLRPEFTAEWRRLRGRWRVRRTKGQSLEEARARARARNTPPGPEVTGGDRASG